MQPFPFSDNASSRSTHSGSARALHGTVSTASAGARKRWRGRYTPSDEISLLARAKDNSNETNKSDPQLVTLKLPCKSKALLRTVGTEQNNPIATNTVRCGNRASEQQWGIRSTRQMYLKLPHTHALPPSTVLEAVPSSLCLHSWGRACPADQGDAADTDNSEKKTIKTCRTKTKQLQYGPLVHTRKPHLRNRT